MPIKSITLQKLEEMEKKAAELGRVDIDEHTVNQVETATANNLEKIQQAANKASQKISFGEPSSSSTSGASKSSSSSGDSASTSSFPPLSGQKTNGKNNSGNADVWKAEWLRRGVRNGQHHFEKKKKHFTFTASQFTAMLSRPVDYCIHSCVYTQHTTS